MYKIVVNGNQPIDYIERVKFHCETNYDDFFFRESASGVNGGKRSQ